MTRSLSHIRYYLFVVSTCDEISELISWDASGLKKRFNRTLTVRNKRRKMSLFSRGWLAIALAANIVLEDGRSVWPRGLYNDFTIVQIILGVVPYPEILWQTPISRSSRSPHVLDDALSSSPTSISHLDREASRSLPVDTERSVVAKDPIPYDYFELSWGSRASKKSIRCPILKSVIRYSVSGRQASNFTSWSPSFPWKIKKYYILFCVT